MFKVMVETTDNYGYVSEEELGRAANVGEQMKLELNHRAKMRGVAVSCEYYTEEV